jgi:leader peptidase (prepilin peptidase)/N-methyltransferase
VEISTAALFVFCRIKFGPHWVSIAWAMLCFLLLGLAVMDMETMLLPNRFTVPGFLLGLLFAAAQSAVAVPEVAGGGIAGGLRGASGALLHAGIAALCLLGIMGLYWLVRRRAGMGMGDVKLLAMIAAWLGLPQTALAFAMAVICGAACGAVMLILSKREERGALRLPFGAFLSLAGIYCIFLGERTMHWYANFLA